MDKDIESTGTDFIREAVAKDLKEGRYEYIRTRLPPEPNGYLHIGHVKAFMIDYLIAQENGGELILRFDDTNPAKEESEFVDAIMEDAAWMGIRWVKVTYASDYFGELYEWAKKLVRDGKAYVDDQTPEEVSKNRGTLTSPGFNSPYRDRSVNENLDLLEKMKNGEFPDGSRILRAKIDMTHPNMVMRDPAMYRIIHEPPHHRTGRDWCIYPLYDWSHGQNDSMERITHSLCSMEYEIHRPLYEWFLAQLGEFQPRQLEFSRLNLTYAMMSKRKLRKLVEKGLVKGWDDPRLTTLRGMRRRGYPSEAIATFIKKVGIAKTPSWIEFSLLESCVRDELNKRSLRKMAVVDPIKVIIDNYPEGLHEELSAINNPEDPAAGNRSVQFGRELYIEREDFEENPPPKYYRLYPGNEVRLRYAYYVKCVGFEKDHQGKVTTIHCEYDPATRGGDSPDGRKVKSTIHWVSADNALNATILDYGHLFLVENPDDTEELEAIIDPNSLIIRENAKIEASLSEARPGDQFQFERLGYYCVDRDSKKDQLIFNRTVTLKDSWAKIQNRK
ncbi:MAG TPA: glutamine--tRNA ligase/YqeY domain fusion protein [Anaerolineales bacterium]|nr:glutamine--tRNA ligase/YqeY domain fusion protein [Anaerolineales bacterium]